LEARCDREGIHLGREWRQLPSKEEVPLRERCIAQILLCGSLPLHLSVNTVFFCTSHSTRSFLKTLTTNTWTQRYQLGSR